MQIRKETAADSDAITTVTVEAFKTLEVSDQTEQFVIIALRKAGALTISLVAEMSGEVVGHIAFSPVTLSDGTQNWYGLGPVSVLPKFQKQGIGAALINEGLSMLKEIGAAGCALVGHPGYYKRFGFKNSTDLTLDGVPQEAFFVMPFNERIPQGKIFFHEAFLAKS
ncbi:GCN5-related N-acetyltransferase [Chloroherpeton thalassium ATCC 35110]|uniref:GCN5-related N-acetyltransferase n=1 Tax=Chloroherpeton thalassium (strain ATCC 35110 / GB-78) TaxID=517418 RepID=B3QUV9_CHLT3|nr:N-acetyltransferase [Chloroherpeton thalassium]ACF14460.1 GCN5-related N-acetyltransferase [Chloroherpeton thalassium ATCC 35110]